RAATIAHHPRRSGQRSGPAQGVHGGQLRPRLLSRASPFTTGAGARGAEQARARLPGWFIGYQSAPRGVLSTLPRKFPRGEPGSPSRLVDLSEPADRELRPDRYVDTRVERAGSPPPTPSSSAATAVTPYLQSAGHGRPRLR